MSLTIRITGSSNVLYVLIEGEFTLESANRTFLEVLDAVKEHQCKFVLMDGRMVTGNPTIVERYYYGEFASASVNALRPRFAYILHEPVLDPLRLGETVAVNRGMQVKVFDKLAEGVNWLELKPEELKDLLAETSLHELMPNEERNA
jgi:hypothetical protein